MNGTSWIQVESVIRLIDELIDKAETDEAAKLLRVLRKELIDELNELPFEWRRS